MKEHLRHRWWLRAALVAVALLLAWSQWAADPAANLFVAVWAVAAIVGALGSTLPAWGASLRGVRTSRLPRALQGVLVGAVAGAFLVLLVDGRAPIASGGLLIALVGVYDDLLRPAWQGRPGSSGPDRDGAASAW
jgi:hypothetical protein